MTAEIAVRPAGDAYEVSVSEGASVTRHRVTAGAGVQIAPFARFTGAVSLGRGVRIGRGASLTDCVVLDGATIGDGARLERCVVGEGARVGTHAILGPGAALAGGSKVGDYSQL